MIRWKSTKNSKNKFSLDEVLLRGLASDGGLFVPTHFPKYNLNKLKKLNLTEFSIKFLEPFFQGSFAEKKINLICKEAFNFQLPIEKLSSNLSIFELYHGPTNAFKDFAARFLAATLKHIPTQKNRTVLVATSGDTGGAVAAAFFKKPKTNVVILYPKNKVSKRQELQLTTWGHNVHAFAVSGTFDDCQKLVKSAFLDSEILNATALTSANSINVGRILPQAIYHAYASLKYPNADFIIPTGNLGNAVAAFWAKACGFPILRIHLSLNSNRVLETYYKKGKYSPVKAIPTLANAMDVSIPSNLERLQKRIPNLKNLNKISSASSVSDQEIKKTIQRVYKTYHRVICPHTATAFAIYEKQKSKTKFLILSTAHPAKFESIVEPIIHARIPVPKNLKLILDKKGRSSVLQPDFLQFKAKLLTLI